jgi:hypothetical protein
VRVLCLRVCVCACVHALNAHAHSARCSICYGASRRATARASRTVRCGACVCGVCVCMCPHSRVALHSRNTGHVRCRRAARHAHRHVRTCTMRHLLILCVRAPAGAGVDAFVAFKALLGNDADEQTYRNALISRYAASSIFGTRSYSETRLVRLYLRRYCRTTCGTRTRR